MLARLKLLVSVDHRDFESLKNVPELVGWLRIHLVADFFANFSR